MNSVTIRDIAREAGVSVATVSRTLNHESYVTEAMQTRVMEAAAKLGYVPNCAARSLKTNSSHMIGVLLSDISNPDYISIIRTIEDMTTPEHYSLILCSTGDQQARELESLQNLLGRNIDGLILNTTELNNDFVTKMSAQVPTLLLNRTIADPAFRGDDIHTNSYLGIYQLTKQLLALGHRRIYLVQGPPHLRNSRERFRGFQTAMEEANISVNKSYPYLFEGDYTPSSGVEAVRRMSRLDPCPTALITSSNVQMLGVLQELRCGLYNIRVPEDLTLATYDSLPNLELLSIRPLTVQFDNRAIGVRCASALLERIKDRSLPNRTFTFEPTLTSGNAMGFPSDR